MLIGNIFLDYHSRQALPPGCVPQARPLDSSFDSIGREIACGPSFAFSSGFFTVVLIVVWSAAWWFVYRPLPQLDGTISLPGLHKEVTVERDNWGVPHIRAASLEDAVEAQGYVMAQDRLWQLDLMRRASRGQLSEIVGPLALKSDRQFRTFGFSRAAERDFAAMDQDSRTLMEAYARGVNRFIDQHQKSLPRGIFSPQLQTSALAAHRFARHRRLHVPNADRHLGA